MDRSRTRADNDDDATSPTDAGVMSRSLPNRNYVFVFTTMTRKNKYHIIYQKNLALISYVLSECICDMLSCGNSFPSQKRKKSRDSNSSFFCFLPFSNMDRIENARIPHLSLQRNPQAGKSTRQTFALLARSFLCQIIWQWETIFTRRFLQTFAEI